MVRDTNQGRGMTWRITTIFSGQPSGILFLLDIVRVEVYSIKLKLRPLNKILFRLCFERSFWWRVRATLSRLGRGCGSCSRPTFTPSVFEREDFYW